MPAKVYKVTLNDEERSFLNDVTSKGRAAARKLNHAHILLKADQSENGPGWDDQKISEYFNVSVPTVGFFDGSCGAERRCVSFRCIEFSLDKLIELKMEQDRGVNSDDRG